MKKVSITTGFLLILFSYCTAQNNAVNTGKEVFTIVEQAPEFPGGEKARSKFMTDHVKYPDSAINNNVQGTVYASFVVETDGSLTNIEIIKGIGYGCDEEVIRLIKVMPKWTPGEQKGKPVKVQFNLPIKFALNDKKPQ